MGGASSQPAAGAGAGAAADVPPPPGAPPPADADVKHDCAPQEPADERVGAASDAPPPASDDDDDADSDAVAAALDWAERGGQGARVEAKRGGGGGGGARSTPPPPLGPSAARRRPNANGGAAHGGGGPPRSGRGRGTAPSSAGGRPGARALQPATAAARALDAVFDGALRPAYHHDADAEDDDDLVWEAAGAAPGGAATAARSAAAAARRADARAAPRDRDRADRATVETVLDPRTRLVLFKLLNARVFAEIHGCVSTGKEANVYHAIGGDGAAGAAAARVGGRAAAAADAGVDARAPPPSPPPPPPLTDLAVKVYKTSVLAFRDRHRYVAGDFRYERGYAKGNARRMVRLWAEKEARNLARLAAAGVACPRVVTLRSHVLVMEFVGDGSGGAAPRLKDARLSRARAATAHRDVLLAMRSMYARARLVHADLSEYNILYSDDGRVIIIDVSQSVDLDHPLALDFLRADAANVARFFGSRGVAPVLGARAAFDWVTDPRALTRAEEETALDAALAAAAEAGDDDDGTTATADAVFRQSHIPRRLADVSDPEADHARLAAGGRAAEGIYYQALAGMAQDMGAVVVEEAAGGGGQEGCGDASGAGSDSDASSSSSSGSSSSSSSANSTRSRRAHPGERACTMAPADADAARAARRAAKAAAKEVAREKRKTKTPKHVKKRATQKGKKKR